MSNFFYNIYSPPREPIFDRTLTLKLGNEFVEVPFTQQEVATLMQRVNDKVNREAREREFERQKEEARIHQERMRWAWGEASSKSHMTAEQLAEFLRKFQNLPYDYDAQPPPPPKPRRPLYRAIDAVAELEEISGYQLEGQQYKALLRRAQRKAHPDTGGSKELFQRVGECETILKRERRL